MAPLDQDSVTLEYERGWLQWRPTSFTFLARVERRIFSYLKHTIQSKFVNISDDRRLWTIWSNPSNSDKTPIVLLHGMGGGVALWTLNLDNLSQKRPLYALDLLGFGQSSRCTFSSDAAEAEATYVESIEQWREAMGLEKFILLGHSFGGFLASCYTLKYPQRVKHLILADPWGFPEKPLPHEREYPLPVWAKVVGAMLSPFNPLSVIRAAGPWGPGLIQRFRPDLKRIFSSVLPDDTIFAYIYHCNAQNPSGETAFKHMSIPIGWAKYPMINRIAGIATTIPITMVYGSRSWLDSGTGYRVKYLRHDSYVDVQVIRGAGHHVYADKADAFNVLVKKIGDTVDHTSPNEDDSYSDQSPDVDNVVESDGELAREKSPSVAEMLTD